MQVSVIFCHCFSLNSGSHSIAIYFVSLCPGNVSNSEKLPGQFFFCHCLSLNSGSHSIAVYFVSLCPGNFSNSEKLPGQCYFFVIPFI